jgi:hypothetical protein
VPSHRPSSHRNVIWIASVCDRGIGMPTNERPRSVGKAVEFVIVRHSSRGQRTLKGAGRLNAQHHASGYFVNLSIQLPNLRIASKRAALVAVDNGGNTIKNLVVADRSKQFDGTRFCCHPNTRSNAVAVRPAGSRPGRPKADFRPRASAIHILVPIQDFNCESDRPTFEPNDLGAREPPVSKWTTLLRSQTV